MKWFRRHLKTGSRLALFALAIQFALSFGHFHFDRTLGSAPTDVGLESVHASGAAESFRLDQHDNDHEPALPCATCAILTLASNLVLSPPPGLLLPEAVELACLEAGDEPARLKSGQRSFQPRAPPVS